MKQAVENYCDAMLRQRMNDESPNLKTVLVKDETLRGTLEKIGLKLTELRKKKGYTSHEDFAYDYNIPRVQYWRIEKGRTNVTIKSLCRLLTIHQLTLEEFFCILQKENQ